MAVGAVLNEMWIKYEAGMSNLYATASTGISNYVVPIAWILLGILLLWWCLTMVTGGSSMPVMEWIKPTIAFAILLYVMGAGYLKWVADPLWKLPEALAAATGYGGTTPIQNLSSFEDTFTALISASFLKVTDFVTNGAFGAAIVLALLVLVLLLVGVLLMVVVFCGLLYAKLGLTFVLAVGPFFILGAVLSSTRDKFMSWLNTALFFVFYYVLCILFMAIFFNLLNTYLGNVANISAGPTGSSLVNIIYNNLFGGDTAAATNVLVQFLPLVLGCPILALMFLQISTIAGSMTGGSGGAAGQGLSSLIYQTRMFNKGKK